MMKKITFILTMIFSLVLTNTFAQGSCATAVPLTPGTQQCGDTSSGADVYDNNTCLGDYDGGDDYIFSYVASATGETLTLDLTGVAGWTGFAMSDDCPDVVHNCFGSATTTSAGDINFTSDPLTSGVTYYIHISTWPSPQSTAFCLDAVVNPAPTCIDPDTFASSNVTTNTVDLSWNDPSGTQFDFEYVVQASGVGTPAGSGVAVGATSATGISTELDTTPLAPATDYEAWVRADCGGGDYSAWVGPIYFTTLCTTTVAPFLESFETPALPACWTQGGDNAWEFGSSATTPTGFAAYGAANVPDHSVSGTGTFIGMDGSDNIDGDVSTLTTPMIDISGLTTPYLSYYVFSNNVDDAAQNELLVEFYDGAAWNTVETIQANLGADWVMYGVDLTAFTITGDVQARFTVTGVANGGSAYYNDILIDDVSIDEAPTCFAPTGLAVSNVTTNTVDITWNDGSGGAQFDFYYVIQPAGTGTAGITVENYYDYSSGVPFTATCTDITDCANTLLTPNTAYEVFVRDDCGGAWVGPINFTTACDAFAVPFMEGFNSASTSESCWTVLNENGDGDSWNTNYATNPYEGDEAAMMYTDFNSGANDDWLISPTITLTGNQRLKFHYRVQSAGEPNDFELLLSTTGTAPASFTNTLIANTSYDNITYVEQIVDLSAYSGDVNIAWHVPNGGLDGWRLYIDNVIVEDLPSCIEPDTFVASNVTTNTVDLSWNDPSGTQFDFEYVVQASGVGMPAGSGVAVGTNSASGISTEVDTTPLAPNTAYEAWVRADCGGGDYSAWVGPIYFTTPCDAIATFPFTETFEDASVSRDCWSNIQEVGTADWTYQTGSSGGTVTTAYNGTLNARFVSASGTASPITKLVSPTLDLTSLTTPRLNFYYAQEDWSGDQNELKVYYRISPSDSWVEIGYYTTSIAAWTQVILTLPNPSATYQIAFEGINNWGRANVVDDVTIEETPACPEPTGLSVMNITDTTADFSWTATTGNYEYVLDMNAADPAGSGTAIAGETYNATGLTPETTYYFHVRTDCGSTWTTISFTTLATPPANDDCANAIALTPGAVFTDNPIVGTNVGATDSGETAPGCASYLGGDVWYSAQVPASGSLTFEMNSETGGITDGAGAVYSGTCGSLVLIDCDDFSSSDPNDMPLIQVTGRTPGEVLYFMVWEYSNDNFGEFQVSAYDASLSANSFDSNSFVAYPNPVKDVLTLEYSNEITNVSVYNMLGQEVLSRTIEATSTQIDMSSLNAGTYLVNVSSGDIQKTIKVVKQ